MILFLGIGCLGLIVMGIGVPIHVAIYLLALLLLFCLLSTKQQDDWVSTSYSNSYSGSIPMTSEITYNFPAFQDSSPAFQDSFPTFQDSYDLQGSRNHLDDERIGIYEEERLKVDNFEASAYGRYNRSKENYSNCAVCGQEEELSVLKKNQPWGYLYCDKHHRDGSIRCCSCLRHMPMGGRGYRLNDGRFLCPECLSTAVLDTDKLESILATAHEFYRRCGLDVDADFPVVLVDSYEMDRMLGPGSDGVRGVTTNSLRDTQSIDRCIIREDKVGAIKSKRTATDGVVGIALLYGFPEAMTTAVLVHEMMHVWLDLQGCPELDGRVGEGICEVMANMWQEEYESSLSRTSKSDEFQRKLLIMEKRPRPVYPYGVGFIEGKRAVDEYGLMNVLNEIVENGEFP